MFDLFLSTWPEVFPLTSTFAAFKAFKAALVIIYTQDSLVLFRHVCMLQICLHNAHELLVLDIVLEEKHCAFLRALSMFWYFLNIYVAEHICYT